MVNTSPAKPARPKILIVDDDERNLLSFEVALKSLECEIHTASSGKKALDLVSAHEYAAVLLDVQMPEMNGYETAQRLRTLPNGRALAVLFITAGFLDSKAQTSAYESGGVDLLSKPVDALVLESKIKVFLELYEARIFKRAAAETRYFLEGGGEMPKLFRECDWSKTAIGPIPTWPQSLKTAVGIILNSSLPMFITWGEKKTFFYNDAYAPILGKKHPKALGSDFKTVWSDIWSDILPLVSKVDAGEPVFVEDMKLVMNRKGFDEVTYFTFSYSPIRGESDEVVGLFCACVETTERKKTEDDLRKSESRYREIAVDLKLKSDALENSLAGFDIVDENGKLIYVNPAYLKMWGYSSVEEVLGSSPADHCAEPETPFKIITSLKQTGACDIEFVAKRKDGSTFDVRMLAFLAHDSSGREIYPTTSIDITEQKRAQRKIEESERKLDQIFNQSPATLSLLIGPELIYEKVNKKFLEITGFDQSILGKSAKDVFKNDPGSVRLGDLEQVYKTGNVFRGTELPVTFPSSLKGRRDYFFDYICQPLKDAEGNVYGVVTQTFDVTEKVIAQKSVARALKEMEKYADDLRAAKEEAERANELKSAFLANMSHEIRTPLGAMIGFTDLLRDPGLNGEQRSSYIDILARNGENLSVIINDILDLSKVEAGHLTLEYTEAFPIEIAKDVISLLRVKAEEKDLDLGLDIDPSTPETLISDPMRLRQILINLIGNAIKFTQFGGITLHCSGKQTPSGRLAVCFEVIDTGIGIPETQREKVFEMFVQADGSTTRRFGGTGLGLALSRSLARAMAGDIVITASEPGKGTTFLVTVEDQPDRKTSSGKAKKEEIKHRAEQGGKSLEGVKVLVVDDAPDNQQLIWHYLNRQGAIIDSAENGLVGFKMALAGDYDIVLMDIQMPEMDGYTATHKLRAAGYRKPIVALTAHAMNEVRDKVLNLGANAHLPKPINFKDLIAMIADQVH